jgi:uncharacterized protein YcgI (DUF1989 family)
MQLEQRIVVPPCSGKAFEVRKDQVLRIALPEGPQVVDLNAFNRDNVKEAFSSSSTRQYEGAHVTTGSRLFSGPPYERVMFSITADTVQQIPDPRGTATHDVLGGRCCQTRRKFKYGSDTPGCQEYLAAAIAEYGLGEEHVHDAFNVFMKTGIDEHDKYFWVEPDAVAGDYIDLRAEMDCLVAVSTCPGRSSGPVHHPVSFEIYQP